MKYIIILILIFLIIERYGRNKSRKTTSHLHAAYDILNVPESATDEEVKLAYREQSRKHHPDLMSHQTLEYKKAAENRLKLINEAYEQIKKQRKL